MAASHSRNPERSTARISPLPATRRRGAGLGRFATRRGAPEGTPQEEAPARRHVPFLELCGTPSRRLVAKEHKFRSGTAREARPEHPLGIEGGGRSARQGGPHLEAPLPGVTRFLAGFPQPARERPPEPGEGDDTARRDGIRPCMEAMAFRLAEARWAYPSPGLRRSFRSRPPTPPLLAGGRRRFSAAIRRGRGETDAGVKEQLQPFAPRKSNDHHPTPHPLPPPLPNFLKPGTNIRRTFPTDPSPSPHPPPLFDSAFLTPHSSFPRVGGIHHPAFRIHHSEDFPPGRSAVAPTRPGGAAVFGRVLPGAGPAPGHGLCARGRSVDTAPPAASRAREAEAQVVVPVARIVPVAIRRTAVPGVVVPAAAPFDPVGAPSAPNPGHDVPR